MGSPAPRAGRRASPAEVDATMAALADVRRELEELGLSPYEARVLLALLRLGQSGGGQLAKVSGVPRTSVYSVLEELAARRLVDRLPGDKVTLWACPGLDLVFDRLDAAEEERLRTHRARAARVREALATTLAEGGSAAAPYLHVVKGSGEVRAIYDRILSTATDEVLVMNRPPYSSVRATKQRPDDVAGEDEVNPLVLDGIERGVRFRALYEADHWERPDADGFRQAMAAYHRAGVEGRLAESLPVKLAVGDRKVALLALHDADQDIGFPANLFVEHPDFAQLQADAFERQWEMGVPVVHRVSSPRRGRMRSG